MKDVNYVELFFCVSCVFFICINYQNNINSFASDLTQNIHLQIILFYVYLFFNKNEYTRDFNLTFCQIL